MVIAPLSFKAAYHSRINHAHSHALLDETAALKQQDGLRRAATHLFMHFSRSFSARADYYRRVGNCA